MLQMSHRNLIIRFDLFRGYRNPEFFRKMVEHYEINQYGSCFPSEVGWNEGCCGGCSDISLSI